MLVNTVSPDQHRKRLREEDDEAYTGGPVGFTEHRSKRLQSLPLRTSPTSKRWLDRPSFPQPNATFATPRQPQIVTPQEPVQEHMWADEPELAPGHPPPGMAAEAVDDDMDMMDTSESVPSREQQGHQMDHTAPSVTGRIPTPIHCTFAAQVRGNSWNGGHSMQGDALATTPEEPNAAAFASNGLVDIAMQEPSTAAIPAALADWSMVQNRRLPSPISECGAEDSQGSAHMAVDPSFAQAGGHLSQVTHEHPLVAELPPRASSAMGGRPGHEVTPTLDNHHHQSNAMDIESPSAAGAGSGPPAGTSTGTGLSPKKGHTRSKHTLNSWTALQPGMTRSFSIGYRADCEKCRNKMPGHFNHIIIS